MPHMAEDIWQRLPYDVDRQSVFQAGWPEASEGDAELVARWERVRAVRDVVNKVLDDARAEKAIGASLEAKLLLHTSDPALASDLADLEGAGIGVDELRYVFITSSVEVLESAEAVEAAATLGGGARTDEALALTVGLALPAGVKCERCWDYSESVGESKEYPGVCRRCIRALKLMSFPPPVAKAEEEEAPVEAVA